MVVEGEEERSRLQGIIDGKGDREVEVTGGEREGRSERARTSLGLHR